MAAALQPAIWQAGHGIGNHTLNHQAALGDRPDAAYARAEIDEAQALIGTQAGAERRNKGYTSVLWNRVPGDWRNPDGWNADCDAAFASLD